MKNLPFVWKPVLVLLLVTFSLSAFAGEKCCKKKKKSSGTQTPPVTVEPGKPAK
jgi:hypothetical protein